MLPPTPIGGRVDLAKVFFIGKLADKTSKLGNHVSGTLGYLAIHYVQDPNFRVSNVYVCIYIYDVYIYIYCMCVFINIYIPSTSRP